MTMMVRESGHRSVGQPMCSWAAPRVDREGRRRTALGWRQVDVLESCLRPGEGLVSVTCRRRAQRLAAV